MRNITIDVLTFNERLRIGKQGENLTREITFDCAAWLDTLSGGVLSIVHQRPTDSDAYPCGDYTVTDTSLTWSINETDLAFSGLGRCELRYTIGSRIAKSKTFYTEIITALNPLDTPPAAYEPYIDRVIDAARLEMDALSVGGTASETERLSVRVDKIVPVDPDDGYEIYFQFGIPKGADGKGVSNATASVDNNTGTPSVTVTTTDTEEGMDIDFSFHNLKGTTGAAGQDGDSVGTVTASVDNNTGTPSVTVTTSGGSGSPVGIDLAFHNLKGQSFDTSFLPSDTASGSIASFPDGAKNVAVDELVTTIVPQQAGSGTPSPSNPRAISGRTQTIITNLGQNVWDEQWEVGSITASGGDYPSTARIRSKGYNDIIGGASYYCKSSQIADIHFYDSSYTHLSYIQRSNNTFDAPSDAKYFRFCLATAYGTTYNNDISINLPSTATTYKSYRQPISQTVPFGQTVYGGSLNITTGVLTIDTAYVTLNGTEANNTYAFTAGTGVNRITYVPYQNEGKIGAQFFYSNIAKASGLYSANPNEWEISNSAATVARCFIGVPTTITSVADWKTFLTSNNMQLCYKLATSQTVQLTPTEVDTILGSNNIYSDCGEVSVKYRADIGLYIDKKLGA